MCEELLNTDNLTVPPEERDELSPVKDPIPGSLKVSDFSYAFTKRAAGANPEVD